VITYLPPLFLFLLENNYGDEMRADRQSASFLNMPVFVALAGGKVAFYRPLQAPAGGKVAPAGGKVAPAGSKVLYSPLEEQQQAVK
jgi:hypothetical protein